VTGRVGVGVTSGVEVGGRVLGRVEGARPGPSLICVGGLHGNEPAGIYGIRRVLEALGDRRSEASGALVALAGNLPALMAGRRFVDRDLNRAWSDQRLADLRSRGADVVEDGEQLDLIDAISGVVAESTGPVFALDLHTTSGPGGLFSVFSDALPHRDFAARFPVPMIFGLEEQVDGTLVNLLSEHGIVALTVETGQHAEPAAVDRAEAAVWIAIVAAGLLPERLVPEAARGRELLRSDSAHLPRALEMRFRRAMVPGDGFAMEPGYTNFQKVRRGEAIARDNDGLVRVGEDARLLMPLYQEQGEDGFFLVREFKPLWMSVSRWLRRAGAARWARHLPGVARSEESADEVVVDKRVARFFARQLFHLLGYRHMEEAGDRFIMRRRSFDSVARPGAVRSFGEPGAPRDGHGA
jgi:predicted deacylase